MTFAVTNQDGSTSIYYDSWRCAARRSNGDIYRVTIPAGGGAIVSAAAGGGATGAASKRLPDRFTRPAMAR